MKAYKFIQTADLKYYREGSMRVRPISFYRGNEAPGGMGDPTEALHVAVGPEAAAPLTRSGKNNPFAKAFNTGGNPYVYFGGILVVEEFDAYVWCASTAPSVAALLSLWTQAGVRYDACIEISDFIEFALELRKSHPVLQKTDIDVQSIRYGGIIGGMNDDLPDSAQRLFMKPPMYRNSIETFDTKISRKFGLGLSRVMATFTQS